MLRAAHLMAAAMGKEEEPSPDADDDFDEPEPPGRDAQRRRMAAERDEHNRAADVAVAAGALEQRPRRAAATAANAAMDVLVCWSSAVSWTDARKAACSVGLWYET